MKKWLIVSMLVWLTNALYAQYGIGGGIDLMQTFGYSKPYVGFHVTFESPKDNYSSMFGRIGIYAKQTDPTLNLSYVEAINSATTSPSTLNVNYQLSTSYVTLTGGNRYYMGEGYDSGFGAYGGGIFQIALSTVKRNYAAYDETLYALPSGEYRKGSIFNLGVGLNGGLKYTFAGVGTIYFETEFTYMLLGLPSNTTASSTTMYSPLLLNFGLGFRKDLY